jgi:hypothetical protein
MFLIGHQITAPDYRRSIFQSPFIGCALERFARSEEFELEDRDSLMPTIEKLSLCCRRWTAEMQSGESNSPDCINEKGWCYSTRMRHKPPSRFDENSSLCPTSIDKFPPWLILGGLGISVQVLPSVSGDFRKRILSQTPPP